MRRGRVVYCRSNHPQELFGQHLIAHGLLEAPALVEALRSSRARNVPLGFSLFESRSLGEEALQKALDRSIRESVQDLILWRRGVFFFDDEEPSRQPFEVSLDPRELVLEGTRWTDEEARIRKLLPDDSMFLSRGSSWTLEGLLPPYPRRIAGLVSGEISVADLHDRAGGVHFPFLEAVSQLIEKGILAISRSGGGDAPSSKELDLSEILLGLVDEQVLMGAERTLLPSESVEALVPAWVRVPESRELEALPVAHRAFLEGIDGRTTLRRLLAGDSEVRSDQMELLLLELRRRNLVLLPASLDDVERRLDRRLPVAPARAAAALVISWARDSRSSQMIGADIDSGLTRCRARRSVSGRRRQLPASLSEDREAYSKKAIDLLGRRGHFRAELRRKLAARGSVPRRSTARSRRRGRLGYLESEEELALAFARERIERKGLGRAGVARELARRGAESGAIDAALAALGPEEELVAPARRPSGGRGGAPEAPRSLATCEEGLLQ